MDSDGSDDVRFRASALLDQAEYPLISALAAPMFVLTMVIIVKPLSIRDRYLPHAPAGSHVYSLCLRNPHKVLP